MSTTECCAPGNDSVATRPVIVGPIASEVGKAYARGVTPAVPIAA
jgi:hypothetical protein